VMLTPTSAQGAELAAKRGALAEVQDERLESLPLAPESPPLRPLAPRMVGLAVVRVGHERKGEGPPLRQPESRVPGFKANTHANNLQRVGESGFPTGHARVCQE